MHVILVDPYLNRRTAEAVAARTGATVVDVTHFPGGVKGTEGGYITLMDYLVNAMAKALAARVTQVNSDLNPQLYGTALVDEVAADCEPDPAVAAGLPGAAHRPARGDFRGPGAGADRGLGHLRRRCSPATTCTTGRASPSRWGSRSSGAVVLTFTRGRDQRVPQEALIGIVYVVAAAAGDPGAEQERGGHEELQRSMVGELLVVPPIEVIKTFGLYVVLGVVHFCFRKQFLAISANPAQAEASGLNVRWWDFVFYVLFGLVVTSFVHIGGVLLVFSYLVVPAVCATYLADSIAARFAVGWAIATVASLVSLFITAKVDLPIGAAIVCVLGVMLVLVLVGTKLARSSPPRDMSRQASYRAGVHRRHRLLF